MFNINKFYLFSTILIQIICINLSLCSNDTTCTALRSIFAKHASKFTTCTIDNSQPINMCQSCVHTFIKFQNSYNNMTKLFIDNETRCIDNYINLDRLQIIESIYSNNINLWNRAKCNDCFQIVNGTLTPNKSIEATTFEERYSNFITCMNKTYTNDTIMCSSCYQSYVDLNIYYGTITNENENIGGCMDIVDLMNSTRTFFSTKCCKFRKHNEYIYIGCSVVMLILTILFYILTQKCSVERIPTILQQTRFAESLNQIQF